MESPQQHFMNNVGRQWVLSQCSEDTELESANVHDDNEHGVKEHAESGGE